MAHLYIYILIKIIICNGNLFSCSRFYSANIRYFWINLLHKISPQESLFTHLSGNITTWQIHTVTHPQSIISFSAANHRTLTNIAVLTSIKSIWDDDQIEKLKDNQWKCLWCDVTFQGINTTKYLAHVIGIKCMHIKRCTASIDQAHISRYKELQQIKAANKYLLNDYSQKMISSISRLQDKSS